MNSVTASSASYSLHTAEPNTERSRHTPRGKGSPHQHPLVTRGPDCPRLPSHLPFFVSFFFLSSKAQTPPQEMKDGHLVSRNTLHTQNIQTLFFFFSVSCSLARERTCLITQSVGDPPHTAHPPLTFSVHMLTAKA